MESTNQGTSNKWQLWQILLPFIASILTAFITSNVNVINNFFHQSNLDIPYIGGVWHDLSQFKGAETWEVTQLKDENLIYVHKEPNDGIGIGSYDKSSRTFKIVYYYTNTSPNCNIRYDITWTLQGTTRITNRFDSPQPNFNCPAGSNLINYHYDLVKVP